ncbi:MAG: hypothetical protein PHI37_05660 [Candidatus Gracilibacteria bacterium]|nr:hypothetical protein [Candidatus Gracilibacteria bacterium]
MVNVPEIHCPPKPLFLSADNRDKFIKVLYENSSENMGSQFGMLGSTLMRNLLNPDVIAQIESVKGKLINILGKISLVDHLVLSKLFGLIEISDNLINEFPEEKELKIKKVDRVELEQKLIFLGATKVFEGYIEDIYYDYNDDFIESMNGKISFRIREKIDLNGRSSYYYTVKRKNNNSDDLKKLRTCYEEEFEIKRIGVFRDMLAGLGFKKSRGKSKYRVSYQLGNIKFDIDEYEGIPTLLEIEAENFEIAEEMIIKLGLEKNERTNVGSRKFSEMHGLQQKTFKNPRLDVKDKKLADKPKVIEKKG